MGDVISTGQMSQKVESNNRWSGVGNSEFLGIDLQPLPQLRSLAVAPSAFVGQRME